MADFLTRLASRTLGLAPVAKPLVAPMFAPDSSLPVMTGADEALDALQPAGGPVATLGDLPPVSSSESTVRLVTPRPRHDPIEARLTQPNAGETKLRTTMPAPDDVIVGDLPMRQRLLLTPAASKTADQDALLMPIAGTSESRSPVGASPPAETQLPARPDVRVPSLTSTARSEEPVAASDRSVVRPGRAAPSSWDVELGEPPLLPLNPVKTMSMRRDARAAVTPADEPEPPHRPERGQAVAAATLPMPTIEITIGRVEVRAMHQPAPVARPQVVAPTAPRLSLEEYLRNQNGGRR
jgi:hypothetical protein